MKKYLAFVLAICLTATFALCGCGGSDEKKPAVEKPDFKAPADYASVVQVVINPTVNLYLDGEEVILAVEYVNKDAEKCYAKIEKDLVGSKVNEGVEKVIETAKTDGYLKENKTVTIDVIEVKLAEEKLVILEAVTQSAKTYITENEIAAEVVLTEEAQKEIDQKKEAEEAAKKEAEEAAKKEAEEKAKKEAEEKAKKEAEEAAKKAAEKEAKNPIKNLKKGPEYFIYKPQEDVMFLTSISIKFKDNGEYSYGQSPWCNDEFGEGEYILHDGKKYYVAGGGGGGGEYTLTDETITLTGGLELVLTMTTDGKLVVKTVVSPTEEFFKVGDVIAIK